MLCNSLANMVRNCIQKGSFSKSLSYYKYYSKGFHQKPLKCWWYSSVCSQSALKKKAQIPQKAA